MMCRPLRLFILFLVLAGSSQAILPPDASVREPEIRKQRIEMEKQYQKRIQKRQDEAAEAYKRATASIDVPPWELEQLSGKSGRASQSIAQQRQKQVGQKNPKHRIFLSIVLLMMIGSAVGWIQYKTRDVEN